MMPLFPIVVMTGSPKQKHDDQYDQPDGQRADKKRNNRQHESNVRKL
jgi:hypothetical protein